MRLGGGFGAKTRSHALRLLLVQRAAATAFLALCEDAEAQQAVAASDACLEAVFRLSAARDSGGVATACAILRKLADHPANRTRLAESPLLRHAMILLMDRGEMRVKADLCAFFLSLARAPGARERLVDAGLLHPLTVHCDLGTASLAVAELVLACFRELAEHSENRPVLVSEGCVHHICRLAFHDLPRALRARSGGGGRAGKPVAPRPPRKHAGVAGGRAARSAHRGAWLAALPRLPSSQ